jgi:hypothetical protein
MWHCKDSIPAPIDHFQPFWLLKLDKHGCLVPGCQHLRPDHVADELPRARLLIAPNPAGEVAYAHWLTERPGEAVFSLRDAQGRTLRTWKSTQPEMTFIIPLQEYSAGIYYLSVLHHGEVFEAKKLVKQ